MKSRDYKTLHEANILTDLIDSVSNAANSPTTGIFDSIKRGIGRKVLKQNYEDNYDGPRINGNIAKSALALTAVFPVIVTEATDVDKAVMISKAIEKKAVTMLQMLFAANQITNASSATAYLNKFHNNLSSNLDLSSMDIDDVLSYADELNHMNEDAEDLPIGDAIKAIQEDIENMQYTLPMELDSNPLSNMKVSLVFEATRTWSTEKDRIRQNQLTRTIKTRDSNKDAHGRTISSLKTTTDKTEEYIPDDKEPSPDDIKKEYETIRNTIVDLDIKKANEAMPSLMIINFRTDLPDTKQVVMNTCVIGVKAMLHYVTSEDLVNRIILKNSDKNGLLNFIRATTGEIAFFKDFLFAVDRAKVDAVSKSGRGSSNKVWKLLELRANKLKMAKANNKAEVGCAAITTVIISQAEIELIKKIHRIDLSKPGNMLAIMKGYNLMAVAIVDDVSEKVQFLYDDGTKNYETLSFMSLEREESGSMYKKVINLAMKGR